MTDIAEECGFGTIQLRQRSSSRLETWRHLRDVAYHDLLISGPGREMPGYRLFTQRRGGGMGDADVGTF